MSRTCPACGGAQGRVLRTMRYALFDDSTLPRHTRIVLCQGCGFVYADSEATAQDYLAHYRRNSIYAAAHEVRAGLSPQAQAPLVERAHRFLSQLPRSATLVDIGAGSGDFLQVMGGLRHDVRRVALDPDPRCVAALQASGLDARLGSLDDLPASLAGKADAVVLSHVLEHVWSPLEGLSQAAALLNPTGVLYVETPDRQGYGENPNVPFYYFDPEHINHFAVQDHARLGARAALAMQAQGRSTLTLAGGVTYPVCWALLRRSPSAAETDWPPTDPHSVERYLLEQEGRIRHWFTSACQVLAAADSDIIVWGTGSQAQRVLAEGLIDACKVLAFVDSDTSKQGRRLAGIPIMAPAEGLALAPQAPVAILAARAASASIRRALVGSHPDRKVLELDALAD